MLFINQKHLTKYTRKYCTVLVSWFHETSIKILRVTNKALSPLLLVCRQNFIADSVKSILKYTILYYSLLKKERKNVLWKKISLITGTTKFWLGRLFEVEQTLYMYNILRVKMLLGRLSTQLQESIPVLFMILIGEARDIY